MHRKGWSWGTACLRVLDKRLFLHEWLWRKGIDVCIFSLSADGSFALASSTLTGRTWNGALWVFNSMGDFEQCPNLSMVAARTVAGVSDAIW